MENLDIENVNFEYFNSNRPKYRKCMDLEESILSCILLKPSLLKEKMIISEDDFKEYPKIFKFFKKMYELFEDLDISLMCSKVKPKDQGKLIDVFDKLIQLEDGEPKTKNFEKYQKALLEKNEEFKEELEEKKQKENIIEIALKLYKEQISLEEFYLEIEKERGRKE